MDIPPHGYPTCIRVHPSSIQFFEGFLGVELKGLHLFAVGLSIDGEAATKAGFELLACGASVHRDFIGHRIDTFLVGLNGVLEGFKAALTLVFGEWIALLDAYTKLLLLLPDLLELFELCERLADRFHSAGGSGLWRCGWRGPLVESDHGSFCCGSRTGWCGSLPLGNTGSLDTAYLCR